MFPWNLKGYCKVPLITAYDLIPWVQFLLMGTPFPIDPAMQSIAGDTSVSYALEAERPAFCLLISFKDPSLVLLSLYMKRIKV